MLIGGETFGASSYAPNGLVSGVGPPMPSPQGRTTFAAIKDGTSNTILHAEKYSRCTNGKMPPAFQDGGTAWAYCTALAFPWQPPPMNLPVRAYQPGFAIAALANLGAPDAIGPRSRFLVQPRPDDCDPTLASTSHPGGIQVGLADGSVRTLSPSMSGFTWWSAVTPADCEVLGSDWWHLLKQSGRWGPYRQASPPPARHRPGARSARRERCLSILSQTEGEMP